MSTMILSPVMPATAAPTVRTRLRLTDRGRRVLGLLAALPAGVAIGIGAVGGTAALAARDTPVAVSYETVMVGHGDTLWGIAQTVAPNADPRDVVDGILRLNTLPGGVLQAGQELAIPAEYSAE